MKQVMKIMQGYAHRNGIDMNSVFNAVLDFLIDAFSVEAFIGCKGDYTEIFKRAETRQPEFMDILHRWIEKSDEVMPKEGCFDFFGTLYEECFCSKSKASAMGQYFTPMSLCLAMAAVQHGDCRVFGEPSCGSGRNALAHYAHSDKAQLTTYRCEDLDPTSVKMCALNMMMNGMYGTVICHNSLDPGDFIFAYAVNEVRVPLPSPAVSIRKITANEYFGFWSKADM